MPRRTGHIEGKCKTCAHAERARIDFLLATGTPTKPLAARFGLAPSSVYTHYKKHVSADYKRAVKIGPLQNEEHLRQLCTENNSSVLETLKAVNAGLTARWLANFEAGADGTFADLTGHLRKNLELMAKLSHELALPTSTTNIVNNVAIFEHPEYLRALNCMRDALKPYPEARKAVAAALRALGPEPPLIEHQAA